MTNDLLNSLKMHEHTERSNTFFAKNSLKEIATRYRFVSKFSKEKKILEVGPGTGFASTNIIANSKSYTCVEYSRENTEIFKINYPNINIINADFTNLDERIVSQLKNIDCIISMANIYYFDFKKFLETSKLLLIDNGKIIFCTTNCLNHTFKKGEYTKKYYKLSELKEILSEYGFEGTFYGGFNNKKLNIKDYLIRTLKFIVVNIVSKNIKIRMQKYFNIIKKLPEKIDIEKLEYEELRPVNSNEDSKKYMVLYCVAETR